MFIYSSGEIYPNKFTFFITYTKEKVLGGGGEKKQTPHLQSNDVMYSSI